jgi:hypothetical protein
MGDHLPLSLAQGKHVIVRVFQRIRSPATNRQMKVRFLPRTPFRADDRELLRNKTLSIAPCSFLASIGAPISNRT